MHLNTYLNTYFLSRQQKYENKNRDKDLGCSLYCRDWRHDVFFKQ